MKKTKRGKRRCGSSRNGVNGVNNGPLMKGNDWGYTYYTTQPMQRAMHQWVKGIISRDHAFAADIREGSDNLITSREHSIQKEKGMLDGQSIMKLLLSKRERPPPSSFPRSRCTHQTDVIRVDRVRTWNEIETKDASLMCVYPSWSDPTKRKYKSVIYAYRSNRGGYYALASVSVIGWQTIWRFDDYFSTCYDARH